MTVPLYKATTHAIGPDPYNIEDQLHLDARNESARRASLRNGEHIIDVCQRVRDRQGFAWCDGALVDLFTAGIVSGIYDALNAENQAKLRTFSRDKCVSVCFKLYERVKK